MGYKKERDGEERSAINPLCPPVANKVNIQCKEMPELAGFCVSSVNFTHQ